MRGTHVRAREVKATSLGAFSARLRNLYPGLPDPRDWWEAMGGCVVPGEAPSQPGSGGSIYLANVGRRSRHGIRDPSQGTGTRVPWRAG